MTLPETAAIVAGAPPAGRRRLVLLLVIAAAVVAAVVVAAMVFGGPGRKVETGVVISVHATSLSNVENFTIRTPEGRDVVFQMGKLENATQFAPGHLAEHMVTLIPVRVTYIDGANGPVAVRLEDAPSG